MSGPVLSFAQVRIGEEQKVDVSTAGVALDASAAMAADGSFVVSWGRRYANQTRAVAARVYDPSGRPRTGELPVDTDTGRVPRMPTLAGTADGDFAVVWYGRTGDSGFPSESDTSVYARRFGADGTALGDRFRVSATLPARWPAAALTDAGVLDITWTSGNVHSNGLQLRRRYDASGAPVEEEVTVNDTSTGGAGAIGGDGAGSFVVAWSGTTDGDYSGVSARRYDAAASPLGAAFRVNAMTTGGQRAPAVAQHPDGRFVVVWGGNVPESPYYRAVFGRMFDGTGNPLTDDFQISTAREGDRSHLSVAMDATGGFLVAWDDAFSSPNGTWDVFLRAYDAGGTPLADEFALNASTTLTDSAPIVSSDRDGHWVVTWSRTGPDAGQSGIFVQRFGPDVVHADGFESAGLSGWSSSAGGADLVVSPDAAMRGSSLGLQGNVNDTQPLFVQDESPRGEHRYRARFYFDPGDFDPGEAQGHFRTRLFIGFEQEPQQRRLFAVVLRRRGGEYALMARARADDNAQVGTGFVPITAGAHAVEIAWTRATGVDSGDGSLELWVDGTLAGSVAALDNDRSMLDFVRLGALSLKAGASGTLSWDEFESRRTSAIGP